MEPIVFAGCHKDLTTTFREEQCHKRRLLKRSCFGEEVCVKQEPIIERQVVCGVLVGTEHVEGVICCSQTVKRLGCGGNEACMHACRGQLP